MSDTDREIIEIDVLFIGAGPASLAGAIRLAQLCREKGVELEIAIIEKGAGVGNHCISGAVMNPVALEELLPDYKALGCPISNMVCGEEFYYLTHKRAFRVPFIPGYLHNKGYPIISLSGFSRWLGQIAEELGIMILPEFCGSEILFSSDQRGVAGVRIGDKGLGKDGSATSLYEPGPDIRAKVTVFGEGARGSLFRQLDRELGLSPKGIPQTYEVGIKEVIRLSPDSSFRLGQRSVIHTLGYPVGLNPAGGGFIYELADNMIGIGFLTALNYEDPYMDPYENFLAYKHHPLVADIIENGEVIEQGARTVTNGGYYALPEMVVDGGIIIGACAGIQNPHQLKGIHSSMKTGMLAAEAILDAFSKSDFSKKGLGLYQTLFDGSWVKADMFYGRHFFGAVSKKGPGKFFHIGLQYLLNGRDISNPMKIEPDLAALKEISSHEPKKQGDISCDGKLYLDKLTGVYLAKTKHREDQPAHLIIHDIRICEGLCYTRYRCPCTRFCPANVYEIEVDEMEGTPRLIVNHSNCLHCKTCDIKDPFGNITWTCPEGGSGPAYTNL